MGACPRLRREIDMLTVIGFAIGFVIAAGVFLAIAMRHDNTVITEQQRVITEFQDILNNRLEEHNPRIQVWLAKNDFRLQPYAIIKAHGHTFYTRSSDDPEVMQAKADEAANFFAKKQLMKWIPND